MEYKDYKSEDFAADESFQNYFLKDNEEDRGYWEKWIEQNPSKIEDIESAKKLLNSITIQVSPKETQAALTQLQQKMKTPQRKSKALSILGMAAIFIGLLVAVFFFQNRVSPDWITLKTDFGKLNQVDLPDGSTAFLNSNSEIKFDKNWTNQSKREVWLKGEAFFTVKKKKNKFIVHSGNSDIEVLGTTFNVYCRNNFTEVALETGKVNFILTKDKNQTQFEMNPQDVIRLKGENEIERLSSVDLKLFTSWREYKLKLKKTPLIKVVNALKDNFGYEVTVDNKSILDRKLTATIPIKDVDILLEALKEIYQLDIKKEGNKIFIK